jgi:hypothetical protein
MSLHQASLPSTGLYTCESAVNRDGPRSLLGGKKEGEPSRISDSEADPLLHPWRQPLL